MNYLVFNKERRTYNDRLRKLRAGVFILDREYKIITIQTEIGDNVFWALLYWLGLFGGIIFTILSLAWIAQM
jgi:hypothetical protein